MLFTFLMMQGALAAHIAEYGPLDHKHNQKHCKVYAVSKDSGDAVPPSVSIDVVFQEYKIAYFVPTASFVGSFIVSGNFARAPPVFLQS